MCIGCVFVPNVESGEQVVPKVKLGELGVNTVMICNSDLFHSPNAWF